MHRSDVLYIYFIRFEWFKESLTFIIVLLYDGNGHYLLKSYQLLGNHVKHCHAQDRRL